ncbi:MAG: transketolase C-terminal domain-containing protein [Caldivirga sp.]|uniref:transketolase C-terminal domain-containing protein n=1 Tax=Caldivirga sp. TaxID=2080243 RepID=UPI003D0A7CCE
MVKEAKVNLINRVKEISNKARSTLVGLSLIDPHIHLGSSLSSIDILATLYLMANVNDDDPLRRDYIILSKGHAAPALYIVLSELGILNREELMMINEPWSPLQGHPEVKLPTVPVSTGSLAQGLSTAVGIARGLMAKGASGKVFVIVGDGELDEGQAWEALMDIAESKLSNLFIIIDYNGVQLDGPVRGIKSTLVNMLKSLGFTVLECDGHDPGELIDALIQAHKVNGPKVIVARTIRGKGVSDIEGTSRQKILDDGGEPGFGSMRDAVGKALLEAGERYNDLYVVTADVGGSTRAIWFKEKFPNRYIDVGIAEQHMIGVASGLALTGLRPVAIGFAMFIMRAWEQVRNTVSRMNLNVKIIGTHSGLSDYADGASHQTFEDISLMRTLPNMTIVVPADPNEANKAVLALLEHQGPAYIRIGRDYGPRVTNGDEFKVGKASVLRDGDDVAIIGAGPVLWDALMAAEELGKMGISTMVINLSTIKPIDADTVIKAAKRTGAVLTIEEHSTFGGVGSAVAEVLAQNYPVPIRMIGVNGFGRSGRSTRQLMEYIGLTHRKIVNETLTLLKGE